MDTRNLLSRRSLLKASPCLVLATALPAAAALPVGSATPVDQSLRMKELAIEFAAAMTAHFGDQFDALIMPDGSFWLNGKHVSLNPDAAIEAAYAEWSAAYDAMTDNVDAALDERLFDELRACERACVKLPPATAPGLAMQFLVFTAFGEFEATKSADHDFEATMLRVAGVRPPRGLADAESVRDIQSRLTQLVAGEGQ